MAVRGGDWPRPLLGQTRLPQGWLGLVETPDGRRRLVPPGEDPRPQRDDSLLLVRDRPVAVPLAVEDVPAACGHTVSMHAEVLLRWSARADDLAALRRTLLSDQVLTPDDLARALERAGATAALRRFVRQRTAADLLADDLRQSLRSCLGEPLKPWLFEAGATLDQVTRLEVVSPDLAERRRLEREAARRLAAIEAHQLVEQAALAAARRRLDGLGELLAKLRSAAAADPGSAWRGLLPALSPAERGLLLENLWRLTPGGRVAWAIVVAAGDECIWLDAQDATRIRRRVRVPPQLGPLRSVTHDAERGWLLAGAATGVWALRADDGQIVARFEVPGAQPQRTGFNAAVVADGRLYATHSRLGCWSWSTESLEGAAADARPVLQPVDGRPGAIRSVAADDDGSILFAADDCVQVWNPQRAELSVLGAVDDEICCLAAFERCLAVGTADGKLLLGDRRSPQEWHVVWRGNGPVESVHWRRWNDLLELVVPAGPQGICAAYETEGVVARLMETTVPIRRCQVSDDLLVGLSEGRDRLVVLGAGSPGRTGREVPVARLLGRSVQDVLILTRPQGAAATGGAAG